MYGIDFCDLTPAEMYDLLKSEAARRDIAMRSSAILAWNTAYLTGLAVNNPKHFPRSADQHFPFLRENKGFDWRRCRDNMAKIAAVHNKRKGAGDDR